MKKKEKQEEIGEKKLAPNEKLQKLVQRTKKVSQAWDGECDKYHVGRWNAGKNLVGAGTLVGAVATGAGLLKVIMPVLKQGNMSWLNGKTTGLCALLTAACGLGCFVSYKGYLKARDKAQNEMAREHQGAMDDLGTSCTQQIKYESLLITEQPLLKVTLSKIKSLYKTMSPGYNKKDCRGKTSRYLPSGLWCMSDEVNSASKKTMWQSSLKTCFGLEEDELHLSRDDRRKGNEAYNKIELPTPLELEKENKN